MANASTRLPSPSAEHRRIAVERFERARQVITTGNVDYGVQLLLACCKLDPGNLIYRQELRRAQKQKHKNNLRGGWFAFLTTAAPKTKLKSARRKGDHLKVLEHGEDVLSRNPWDKGTQLDMSAAADALGHLDLAIFILDQARQKDPKDATINRALARLLEKRGNFTQAIKLWELVKQVDPKDVEAQHKAKDLAAHETIRRGHYQEAVSAESPMKVVLEQNQQMQHAREKSEIVALTERVAGEPTEATLYLQLAAHHRKAGNAERALEVLNSGLAATGQDFRLSLEIAELELEPFRKNLSVADEKLKAAPEDEDLRKVRVRLLKEINTRELDVFRLKSDRYPADLGNRLELGVRLLRAGQLDEAIQELQHARKDDRLHWKAALYLGHCFKGRNNWRLAQRNFEEALQHLPKDDDSSRKEILFQLAQGCAEAGDLLKAIDLAHELANLDYGYRSINRLMDEWQTKLQKA